MIQFVKKYRLLICALIINFLVLILFPQTGRESFVFTGKVFSHFLWIIPPIFICIGLMDVWVEKETMLSIMGEKSGLRGVLIAFLMGMVTAVPLYALLPIAGMLLKKGSKLSNVLIFICSCTSIRIPLLLFEVSSMGWKFTLVRCVINVFIVLMIAFIIDVTLSKEDRKGLYEHVKHIDI